MHITAPCLVLALSGSLTLGSIAAATTATAAGQQCAQRLGAAQQYAEFVAGDTTHSPDSEGAVVIGGDADFTGGFTAGSKLSDAEVDALPGKAVLVVAGNVDLGGGTTTAMQGDFVHGGTISNPGAAEALEGKVVQGPPPLDVRGAFRDLRALSRELTEVPATPGTTVTLVGASNRVLGLTGVDPELNVFAVPASELEKVQEIELTVPDGATTVVNITGDSYNMAAANTTAVKIFDWNEKRFVIDDKNSSANGGRTRTRLLWNLPGDGTLTKSSQAAWPGAVLAPFAHVDLGTGAPVNGSVMARTFKATGGAETHHVPFEGCLPAAQRPTPSAPVTTPAPTPTETAAPTPTASLTAAPSPRPSTTPTPSPVPSSPRGQLADTGTRVPAQILASALTLIGVGGLVNAAVRRRKSKPRR